jgi:hypothetical protein
VGRHRAALLNVAILLAVGVMALILQRRFWQSRQTRQTPFGGIEPDDGGGTAIGGAI